MDAVLDTSIIKNTDRDGSARFAIKNIQRDKEKHEKHLPENRPVVGNIEEETAIMGQ